MVKVNLTDRGDADLNHSVDIDDAITALKYYTAGMLSQERSATPTELLAMDVDESGDITLDDALSILQYYTDILLSRTPDWNTILKH